MAAKVVHEEEFSFVSWGLFLCECGSDLRFLCPTFYCVSRIVEPFWFREGLRRVVAAGD